jgi:hypothetical protein
VAHSTEEPNYTQYASSLNLFGSSPRLEESECSLRSALDYIKTAKGDLLIRYNTRQLYVKKGKVPLPYLLTLRYNSKEDSLKAAWICGFNANQKMHYGFLVDVNVKKQIGTLSLLETDRLEQGILNEAHRFELVAAWLSDVEFNSKFDGKPSFTLSFLSALGQQGGGYPKPTCQFILSMLPKGVPND